MLKIRRRKKSKNRSVYRTQCFSKFVFKKIFKEHLAEKSMPQKYTKHAEWTDERGMKEGYI